MAITYTISREELLIRAYASGMIRAEDLNLLVDSLLADPHLVPGMRGVYDSRYGEPDITILELAEIAGKVRQLLHRGLGRIALVAQSTATHRVSKTFAILARAIGIDVDVFTELPAAEAWLEEGKGRGGTGKRPSRR